MFQFTRIFALRQALLIGVLISPYLSGSAVAQEWSQWGGNERNFCLKDAIFDSQTNFSQIEEAWRIKLGPGNSGISVRNETAFTCFMQDSKEQIVAVSIADGKELWRTTFDIEARDFMDLEFGIGPHVTPLVTDNHLFCVGATGRLSCLDITTGSVVWQQEIWQGGEYTELQRGYAASPVAFKESIVVPVGGNECSVRCYAMKNGKLKWKRQSFDCSYASPVVGTLCGTRQAVLLMDQVLIGVELNEGDLLWEYPVPTERYVNCVTPLIGTGDQIFIATCDGLRCLQLQAVKGKIKVEEKWASRIKICQTSNFALSDDVLYGSKEGGVFAAVDVRNGRTLWQSRKLKECSFVIAGNHVIAVQENGQLVIARLTSSGIDLKWRKPLLTGRCWVGPAIAGRMLFVRDSQKMIALKFPE